MNAWLGALVAGSGMLTGLGAAAQSPAVTGAPPPAEERGWAAPLEITIAPYVWALSLKGDATVKGIDADVDVDFDELLQHLNGAVMLEAELRKGRFGLLINTLYAHLSDNEDFAEGRLEVDATADELIQGLAATYRVGTWTLADFGETGPLTVTVDPYVGARLTYLHAELKAKLDLPDLGIRRKRQEDASKTWIDPVIGLRTIWRLGDRWTATAAGDIGGTDTSSDYSWQAAGLVGYGFGLFAEHDARLMAGYRVLHQKFSDGDGRSEFDWDVTMHGPLLALSITF
jgi:hypothetical protein